MPASAGIFLLLVGMRGQRRAILYAEVRDMGTRVTLLSAATATGVGQRVDLNGDDSAVQAVITGTGTLHATINIEVSNDAVTWDPYCIVVLSEGEASEAINVPGGWNYLRPNIKAISGTNAAVSVYLGL